MAGKLIGIVGYSGAGKTTVCERAIFDPSCPGEVLHIHQTNFMMPIYRMLIALGVPENIVFDKSRWNEPLAYLDGHSTRYAAATLGTEWGRDHMSKCLWINIALHDAIQNINDGISVLIDGVRYPNEFNALQNSGAKMIALTRPGLEVDLSHESERHIATLKKRCDYEITNVEFAKTVIAMRMLLRGIAA